MALIKCPECGKKVSDTIESCIHCGYKLTEKKTSIKEKIKNMTKKQKIVLLTIIGTILILATAIIIVIFWSNNSDDSELTVEDIVDEEIKISLMTQIAWSYDNLYYSYHFADIDFVGDNTYEAEGSVNMYERRTQQKYTTDFTCTCTHDENEEEADCNCDVDKVAYPIK